MAQKAGGAGSPYSTRVKNRQFMGIKITTKSTISCKSSKVGKHGRWPSWKICLSNRLYLIIFSIQSSKLIYKLLIGMPKKWTRMPRKKTKRISLTKISGIVLLIIEINMLDMTK